MSPRFHEDPGAIAEEIVREVGPDIVLALPLGLGKANHIANALYDRVAADPSVRLTILTALTLEKPRGGSDLERRFIGPVIDRLFGGYPELAYAKALREGGLPPNIEVSEFFLLAGRWLGVDYVQQHYIPANYTHAGRLVLERGVNVVAQLVAASPDRDDRYSLSCNTDVTLDLLSERAAGRAKFVMVGQVNAELPYMPGEAEVDRDQFAHMLETPEVDFPLFAPPKQPVDRRVARLVPDGGTLQIGIGSMGDALARTLILRHRDNDIFRDLVSRIGGAPDDHLEQFESGLYGLSEMLVDGFMELAREGVLKREVGGALMHAAFFLGPKSFYRELREMAETDRARFRMTGVSFVNQLYGGEDERRRARTGARFVNNAMMVTLLGSVVSDGLADGEVVSGVGGQYNFVAQAFALPGARSIITLPATRSSGGKTVSNIRWTYANSTIPRHLRDVIVTEYGVAELRGTTDAQCIARMLAVTDSRFQAELLDQAKSAGKISRDYTIPDARTRNLPEAIDAALGEAQANGVLPAFPFGTDFDETERRLIPALRLMRETSASYLGLAKLGLTGMASRPGEVERACLDRMGLSRPGSLSERIYALLLRGGLAETA